MNPTEALKETHLDVYFTCFELLFLVAHLPQLSCWYLEKFKEH